MRPRLSDLPNSPLILSLGLLTMSLGGCGGDATRPIPRPPAPMRQPSSLPIQYIVVIIQENRTPDNLFHGLRNADISDSGVNSLGQTVPLTTVPLANDYDLSHSHTAFKVMYDEGKVDGADKILVICNKGAVDCPGPNLQFRYVNPSDVQPYFQLAEEYSFADRMFQTNQGPSFPAHQFLIAGTSAPTANSDLFAAENPTCPSCGNLSNDAGCTAPPDEIVRLINPAGDESIIQYPCFEHAVLTDLLDERRISWRYYTPSAGSVWTAPDAIQHLRMGQGWNNVILDQKQILSDIAGGQLAQISWVIPGGRASDHASSNDGLGPSWVASVVNALGTSPYWPHTAIFVTWDDWGGWYDHVPPTIYDSYEYGFRVPLIVVSPYTKRGYVSHVSHDFGSILRFIEEDFGLSSLGYADARADNLSDCFDFTQKPARYHPIQAQYRAEDFLNDTRPEDPPDDDSEE